MVNLWSDTEAAMTDRQTVYYCPACGEYSSSTERALFTPGWFRWECPECGTLFRIEVEFGEEDGCDEEDAA